MAGYMTLDLFSRSLLTLPRPFTVPVTQGVGCSRRKNPLTSPLPGWGNMRGREDSTPFSLRDAVDKCLLRSIRPGLGKVRQRPFQRAVVVVVVVAAVVVARF